MAFFTLPFIRLRVRVSHTLYTSLGLGAYVLTATSMAVITTAHTLAFDLFPQSRFGLTFSSFGVAESKTCNPGKSSLKEKEMLNLLEQDIVTAGAQS